MLKKYGFFFWVLPLLMSIRELYQILSQTNGDILELVMFIGFTFWFWGIYVGKFKGE